MQRAFFDEELLKNRARIVLCPTCDNEFRIDLEETEVNCEECGESILVDIAPEEFVWHPSENY